MSRARVPALALPAAALAAILAGLIIRIWSASASETIWTIGLVATGAPIVSSTVQGMLSRRFAADIVATLAIVTSLLLANPLPGLLVVLMQTGGEALERYAEGKASTAVKELESRAPGLAHRIEHGAVVDIPADQAVTGDRLLVRPGELIPCDSTVVAGMSAVDTSRITGEPVPLEAGPGTPLLSGSANGPSPLEIDVRAPARESQYARIVELVRTAQASKAPFQRMADRYAVWFTPFTLLVCLLSYSLSGNWERVLAVLVIATPCPLILATPVAVIGGINRAASQMIVFRSGGALEALGGVNAAVFDKTGTLTIGRPMVARVISTNPDWSPDEVLRLASGVEEASGHPLARSVVALAREKGITPPAASEVNELAGQGVTGRVEGHAVSVGGMAFIAGAITQTEAASLLLGKTPGLRAFVACDGRLIGTLEFQDAIRPGIQEFMARLRDMGLRRLLLLSGDNHANASAVARATGLDSGEGGLLAGDKAERINQLTGEGYCVAMMGDGTNDAPALTAAAVGVALASGGGGIAAEAADVVLLADEPAHLAEAIAISRRTLRIARQSVWVGLGLSSVGMAFAAAGMIPPAAGALLQEGIDLAVIVNALRTSRRPLRPALRSRAPETPNPGNAATDHGSRRPSSGGSPHSPASPNDTHRAETASPRG